MTGFAYAACGMVLAGCAAYAASVWHDHGQPWLLVRARWAWRCRGAPTPPRSEVDPLDRDDMRAFIAVVRAWRQPAAPAPERTRT